MAAFNILNIFFYFCFFFLLWWTTELIAASPAWSAYLILYYSELFSFCNTISIFIYVYWKLKLQLIQYNNSFVVTVDWHNFFICEDIYIKTLKLRKLCRNTVMKTAYMSVQPFLRLACTKKNKNHCFEFYYIDIIDFFIYWFIFIV